MTDEDFDKRLAEFERRFDQKIADASRRFTEKIPRVDQFITPDDVDIELDLDDQGRQVFHFQFGDGDPIEVVLEPPLPP